MSLLSPNANTVAGNISTNGHTTGMNSNSRLPNKNDPYKIFHTTCVAFIRSKRQEKTTMSSRAKSRDLGLATRSLDFATLRAAPLEMTKGGSAPY